MRSGAGCSRPSAAVRWPGSWRARRWSRRWCSPSCRQSWCGLPPGTAEEASGCSAPPRATTCTSRSPPPCVRHVRAPLRAASDRACRACMALIGYHLVWRHVQALQTRERELSELAATAQLAALRAQINPHFLFNSLNSIAQLIHADPEKAEACVERLGRDLPLHPAPRRAGVRAARRGAPDDDAPISTSSARGSTSACAWRPASIRAACASSSRTSSSSRWWRTPSSTGCRASSASARCRSTRAWTASCSRSTVGDDGLGMAERGARRGLRRGVGLRNLRARLERLYGPEHLPEIESSPGRGTVVRLRLPVQEAA